MKKTFNVLFAICLSISSLAQTPKGEISGIIRDGGSQKVIDASTISLLRAKDSGLVKTALTDKTGAFTFPNVEIGNYLVMAESFGHSRTYSSVIEIAIENLKGSVGVLQLTPITRSMKEVVVTSKKPFIERKIDKMVLNVESSITNTGSSALEVLEKAPGVTVDKDGNVSLAGKAGVIIMMDGKPTYMSGPDLANFLRSLPSSNLDQIEIMTNPSAKFDAAGNAGVINIKTKKQKQKGFNGSLSASYGQGRYAKTNNSLNLNYRINKVNLFGNISANYRGNNQNLDIYRRYLNDDNTTKAIFDQKSNAIKNRYNYNAKIGMDFYASPKTTLGFVFTGYTTPGSEKGLNTSYLKSSTGVVDSIVQAVRSEEYSWKNGGVNLNFRHVFDSTGRELTADVDYLTYDAEKDQYFYNNSFNPDWSAKYGDELAGHLPSKIDIYSAKIDYTQNILNGIKMEAGVKHSYVSTDNIAGYYNVNGGVYQVDYEKTNRFQYKENVNAGYVNFSRNIKKWGFQAGLRIENTKYEGYQFGNAMRADSAFENSYTNAFPTAYVSFNQNEKNSWGVSFGRRISRPDYEDLNPFLFFLDKYTYGAGNPYLRPMYSNNFELSHTYNRKFTTTLSFSRTTDLFNETFRQEGYATIQSEGNFGRVDNLGASISGQIKVTKWWNSNLYTEVRNRTFKGLLFGDNLDESRTYALFHANNQFTFKKGWSAELQGFYRTRSLEGQFTVRDIYQVSTGVQKQILKNKGSLKLTVRDIFLSQGGEGDMKFQQTIAYFKQTHDSRVATISFNYRFGKPIKGLQKRKTGGALDEQNRIKVSN